MNEFYEVSDHGRVRSLDRVDARKHFRPGRILRPGKCSKYGHQFATFSIDGKTTYRMIHKLVMDTFVGPVPEGMEVCHADGNPTNNHLANLRYDTHKANGADMVRHGRTRNGEANWNTKLTEDQVRAIRAEYIPRVVTHQMLADKYHVSQPLIQAITTHRIWKHVS